MTRWVTLRKGANVLTAIGLQQREEGLRFDGAVRVHSNADRVTFATFHTPEGDVEVIVSEYLPIMRRMDWGYHGVSHYGATHGDHSLSDAVHATKSGIWWRGYNVYHRRHWSPRHGEYLRVTIEGTAYGDPEDAEPCPYGVADDHFEKCPG